MTATTYPPGLAPPRFRPRTRWIRVPRGECGCWAAGAHPAELAFAVTEIRGGMSQSSTGATIRCSAGGASAEVGRVTCTEEAGLYTARLNRNDGRDWTYQVQGSFEKAVRALIESAVKDEDGVCAELVRGMNWDQEIDREIDAFFAAEGAEESK